MSESNRDGAQPSNAVPSADKDSLAKMRATLAKMDLTPEQTRDDVAPTSSRDSDLLADVPPHHIEH